MVDTVTLPAGEKALTLPCHLPPSFPPHSNGTTDQVHWDSLVLPLPHLLHELVPAEVMSGQSLLLLQLLLYDDLSGNASMVTARVPQGGLAVHSMPACG